MTATITSRQVRTWVSGYRRGETIASLADSSGVHQTTVRYYLKQAGVEMRHPGRRATVTARQVRSWASRHDRGVPIAAIAADAGVAENTVRSHLRRLQEPPLPPEPPAPEPRRPPGRPRKVTDGQIEQWVTRYSRGEKLKVIADGEDVHYETVRRHIAAATG